MKKLKFNPLHVLNSIIDRMQKYSSMTFVWAEIGILQTWWELATPTQQQALKTLINSGRFEIVTGGWVMADEANVHLFAMVNELIEGHQWLKDVLNYIPTTGFAIDTFGHGSTLPYLLAASGFKGTIIQRIHYAWKQFLAKRQFGDFYWQPYWHTNIAKSRTILTHNMPFDTYSIMHSCGPHRNVCMNFDFSKQMERIRAKNIQAKADSLVVEYGKVASLFPHNIALIPLGGDYHYNRDIDIDMQYINYKRLIDFINDHPERYNNTEISFGVPIDYFEEIRTRHRIYPHLKGDFYVYSDIYSDGKPAFWSGYFTTRPMFKMLRRELEHNLRCAEILFTIGLNHARQRHNNDALHFYEKNYKRIILARRNLADFQHHDAITGTSKSIAMKDYGMRMSHNIYETVQLQETTIEMLMKNEATDDKYRIIVSEMKRKNYHKIPIKTPITVQHDTPIEVVLFNSLAQQRFELISIHTKSLNIQVFDDNGTEVAIQINPLRKHSNVSQSWPSKNLFELIFIANLPPLAIVIYTIEYSEKSASLATIHCNECAHGIVNDSDVFKIKPRRSGDFRVKTAQMKLLFDGESGFLKEITPTSRGQMIKCNVNFGAYDTVAYHTGAHLFKINGDGEDGEKDILEKYRGNHVIYVTSGPIAIDVTVIYGNLLTHTVRILQSGTALDRAILIENDVNFEDSLNTRDTEMFMRFVTSIKNGVRSVMYSDQNGFQYHRREKNPNLGIESNYYPITTAAFIQDEQFRFTLLTNHAQGAASLQTGFLEVMLDRRTLYDDDRGMVEGIADNQPTQQHFWIILEQIKENPNSTQQNSSQHNDTHDSNDDYEILSQFGNKLSNTLNYPVNIFYVENQEETKHIDLHAHIPLLQVKFPCDVHLTNLRIQTKHNSTVFPSQRALLVLQRQAASCKIHDKDDDCDNQRGFKANGIDLFQNIELHRIYQSSLTGIYQFSRVTHFDKVYIEPMDIATFNITFASK